MLSTEIFQFQSIRLYALMVTYTIIKGWTYPDRLCENGKCNRNGIACWKCALKMKLLLK